MKNTFKLFGIIALAAVIGFSMTACGGDDSGDDYKLTWGLWRGETYSHISSEFTSANCSLTSAGDNAGYLTGNDAIAANSVVSQYNFHDDGTKKGSFKDLLNYKKDGIGAPQALKDAMLAQKDNVPVGGVFQTSEIPGYSNSVLLFYIEKN